MPKFRGRLVAALLAAAFALATVGPSAAQGNQHQVALGETLWGISRLYGVTVDALVRLNDIANADLILVGQLLGIPGSGDDLAAGPPTSGGDGSYIVQPGDTLSAISLRFNISTQALQAANNLTDPDLIIAGQRLTIPPPEPASAPAVLTPMLRPVSPEIEEIMAELSAAEGVDVKLVKAIAWVESGWQQGVVSPAGAVGIMQIIPETAAWLETDVFGYPLNEDVSAYDNIKAGVRLLRILLEATGDRDLAIAAYYQGSGATQAGIMYGETVQYVETVRAVKDRFWP